MEPVDGTPMLHRAIRAVALSCDEILVSVPFDGDVPEMPSDIPVVLVRDQRPDQGPLIGLWTVLPHLTTNLALVVAGDMPFLERAVLELLVQEARANPDVAVVALDDGNAVRPLPCALRPDMYEGLTALTASGERRLRALIWGFPSSSVPADLWRPQDPAGGSLRDVDRPEDL
jgi:molybdopterin-guanine dinucleotide biosynthesis protein A